MTGLWNLLLIPACVVAVALSPLPMQSPHLSLAIACLTASCSQRPSGEPALIRERQKRDKELSARRLRRKAAKLREESQFEAEVAAFGGPLWGVTVPVPAGVLDHLFRYAAEQKVYVGGSWGKLLDVKGLPEGLLVTAEAELFGRMTRLSGAIEYSKTNDAEKTLCTGSWYDAGYGELKLNTLFPRVVQASYGAFVGIGASARREAGFIGRIFAGKYYDAEILGLEVTREGAEIVTTSRAKNFLLPHIRFAEAET